MGTSGVTNALVVKPDGTVEKISFPKGGLQQAFREHTGAPYFDKLSVAADIDIWLDDEGLLKNDSEVNMFVTALRDFYWLQDPRIDRQGVANYPPAMGVALITGGASPSGHTASISDSNAELIIQRVERLKQILPIRCNSQRSVVP